MIDFETCPCSGKTLGRLVKPAVLLLLGRRDMHGYEIQQELAELPLFAGMRPDNTGVYRALRSMAETGLVTSAWEYSESGPARKVYRLTEGGRECLARWLETLAGYREAIDQLLHLGCTQHLHADRTSPGGSVCCVRS